MRRPFAILVISLVILSLFSFIVPSEVDAADEENLLVLVGDMMTGRRVGEDISEYDDVYYPFRGIGEYTKKGDVTFGNLECAVSERGTPKDKVYKFRAEPRTLEGVRDAGFDVLTLANNHIMDYNLNATLDTMTHIEEYGMKHTGLWYLNEDADNATIQRPAVVESKGVRFAFLGYGENLTYDYAATDTVPAPVPTRMSVMKRDIEHAKTVSDVVVVSIHWRRWPQYIYEADQGQIDMCRELCDSGADILANHGPHTLQEIEYYNGSLIFYSLGNAVFDLPRTESHRSMIAMLKMKGTQLADLELVPIVMNDHNQFIPRGNILKVDVADGLYLNWSDYETKMFNSDEALTDYEGPPEPLWFILMKAALVVLASIAFILLVILFIMIIRRRQGK